MRVTKKYDKVVALRDLSMSIEAGEMFGLIGPDGAGKTTAIRLMCGLLKPDGGSVRVLGRDPVKQHLDVTQTLGYLSQRFSLYGDLSIDENIAFFAEIHGLSMRDPAIRDRRERLLELTQLAKFRTRLAEQLSGGMKQKLALACTLVHEPRIILLDEPTTGVDPVSRREFWKLLSEFLAQGITILMATPYLDEAERCSRVALLHEGRLVALDTPANLRAALPGVVMEVIAPDRDRATSVLERLPGIADVQLFGERAHVRIAADAPLSDPQQLTSALQTAGIAVESVRACSGVARRRVHRASREGNSMKRLLDHFSVSARRRRCRIGANGAAAPDAGRRHRARHRGEPSARGARREAGCRPSDRRAARGRRAPATRGDRELHAHQSRRRVQRAERVGRRARASIPTSRTTCGRGSICSGRSTPAAACRR